MEDLFMKDCIRTFSGKYVNVFNPDPKTIDIIDVAHALSKEQRFGNHLPKNYSVAQHCIICSELVPNENKYTALMHDVTEAYIKDLSKPIKLRMKEYNEIENNLMEFLSGVFGFQYPLPDKVKEVDLFMLKREWNSLMLGNEPFNYVLMNQAKAKQEFLQTYKSLK